MDGGDRLRRRRSLQERLGLACCGSTWGNQSSTISIHGDDHEEEIIDELPDLADHLADEIQILPESNSDPNCIPPSPRMNLADALAAERISRSSEVFTPDDQDDEVNNTIINSSHRNNININNNNNIISVTQTPGRVSLMRLLEETDDQDEMNGVARDLVCCVCMGRKKGAAFIPCGHTFCRVCSRELWLNRGSCPLCNHSILEILDIF